MANMFIKNLFTNIIMASRSLFWQKDKKTLLFGAWFGEKFADNPRYLYQYLSKNRGKYGLEHIVWVSKNQAVINELTQLGYEAYSMDSEESRYYHKKAYYHFICNVPNMVITFDKNGKSRRKSGDILGQYSYRAKRINLWHGTGGLKNVGFGSNLFANNQRKSLIDKVKKHIIYDSSFFRKFMYELGGWGDSFIVSTSQTQTQAHYVNFAKPANKCIETGYPRNCFCPELLENEKKVIDLLGEHRFVILYLPTFRSNSSFSFPDVSSHISSLLLEEDILWIEKPHSADYSEYNTKPLENILKLNSEFDINTILPYVNLLITDYSSVRMDAMFHNIPVIYYVPDFEVYCKGYNGLATNAKELMCGPIIQEWSDLYNCIKSNIENIELIKSSNYDVIRNRYWSHLSDLDEIWNSISSAVE